MDDLMPKLLSELSPIYSSSVSEDEMIRHFKAAVSSIYGVDTVNVINVINNDVVEQNAEQNTLHGYVSKTGKYYIDNQLSEYSSFQELISYRNQGYASCAVLPINLHGKASMIVELLSRTENKFNEQIVGGIAMASSAMGLELAYRYEKIKNTKVANYFSGAFDNIPIQLLVATDNTIVKSNKAALGEFRQLLP